MNKKNFEKLFSKRCEEWYDKNRPNVLLYSEIHKKMKDTLSWMSENNITETITITPKYDRETNKLFYAIHFVQKKPEVSTKIQESLISSCNVTAPYISISEELRNEINMYEKIKKELDNL